MPLAPQSVAVVRAMAPIIALLIRAGYYQRHVPHRSRFAFSTIMNERA